VDRVPVDEGTNMRHQISIILARDIYCIQAPKFVWGPTGVKQTQDAAVLALARVKQAHRLG
jgi:hypothetical protein